MRNLVVTAGFGGYTRPYQDAFNRADAELEYQSIRGAGEVPAVEWNRVFAVIFTGGADIDPSFYGEQPTSRTYVNSHHDHLDRAVLNELTDRRLYNVYKLGTCRGAQLLWAWNGGKLQQHIPHHGGDHVAHLTYSQTLLSKRVRVPEERNVPIMRQTAFRAAYFEANPFQPRSFTITSLHHQACDWESWRPGHLTDAPPQLLLAGESNGQTAVEAWHSRPQNILGFQYHPEWMEADSLGYKWTIGAIQKACRLPVTVDYLYPHSPGG